MDNYQEQEYGKIVAWINTRAPDFLPGRTGFADMVQRYQEEGLRRYEQRT